jgi:hypothetical protein
LSDTGTHDQDALSAQLDEARAKLEGLTGELCRVEDELASLETERQEFALLQEVCVSLEKLGEMNADRLFWDGLHGGESGAHHIRIVRERVDEFHQNFNLIESNRLAILERMQGERDEAEFVEDDLLQLKRVEEEKQNEWVIEREMDDLPPRIPRMPWSHSGEDDQRLRKSMASALLLAFLFAFILTLVTVPLPDPSAPIEVPERLTRLLEEQRPIVEPPTKAVEVPVEEQLLAEETAPNPEPKKSPKKQTKPAESKGVLAFRQNFAGLSDNVKEADAMLGAKARINRTGTKSTSRRQRSMVTTTAPGSSSGINVAALSREVVGGGGADIEGVEVTQATSAIGALTGPERPLTGGPGPARTDEEIQIVFDRHKSALYRLYNRALRKNPTLRGQMVLKLTIETDGSVSFCEIQSSDMKAPQLGQQVAGRVKTFDFGAKEGVSAITILYPIDFLPAT